MEQHLTRDQSKPSVLQQPLGSSTALGSVQPTRSPADMLRAMPPPRGGKTYAGHHSPQEVSQLAQEKGVEEDSAQSDLARAVLAQSQPLTSLVAQLAAGDPITDLGSSSSTLSTKGAQGRAKLQNELAQHKGTFFVSVMQSMARRMQPAQPAGLSPQELVASGVVPTA